MPLRKFIPNAFGEIVVKQKSDVTAILNDDGKAVLGDDNTPQFKDQNNVYEDIDLKDNRGLTQTRQDAKRQTVDYSYTETKKIASKSQDISQWRKSGANDYVKEIERHSTRFGLDPFDRTNSLGIFCNNQCQQQLFSAHNIFGDYLGQGISQNELYVKRKTDSTGHAWFSNADDGRNTIQLRNLLGQEQVSISADEVDLSLIEQEDIQALYDKQDEKVIISEKKSNPKGQLLELRSPIWFKDRDESHPTRKYLPDRWGNVVSEWDSYGSQTDREFSKRDSLLKEIKPTVTAILDNNEEAEIRPTTNFGYNLRGFNIGLTDANHYTRGLELDEAGLTKKKILASGDEEEEFRRDALGRPVLLFDARKKATAYQYDPLDNVDRLTLPSGRIFKFEHNERNQRSMFMNPAGAAYRFNYDAAEDCTQRFMCAGQENNFQWDHNHQQLLVAIPGQAPLTWKRDLHGLAEEHTDLMGRNIRYSHNNNRKLKHLHAGGGKHVDRARLLYGEHNGLKTSTYDLQLSHGELSQNTVNEYQFGLLTSVDDSYNDRLTKYGYDSEERRNKMTFLDKTTGHLLRDIETKYDSNGRDAETVDMYLGVNWVTASSVVNVGYDPVGNRRRMSVLIDSPRYSNECQHQKRSYEFNDTYNENNQIRIQNGVRINQGGVNEIAITGSQGREFEYSGILRASERIVLPDGQVVTTALDYTDDGLLSHTSSSLGFVTDRDYHPAGWVYHYTEKDNKSYHVERFLNCDANSWPTRDWAYDQEAASHMQVYDDKYSDDDYRHQRNSTAGLLSRSWYVNMDNGLPSNVTTMLNSVPRRSQVEKVDFSYVGSDSLQVCFANGNKTVGHYPVPPRHAEMIYDANLNMRLKKKSADEEYADNDQCNMFYETTTDGIVLDKRLFDTKSSHPSPFKNTHLLYNVNGFKYGGYQSITTGLQNIYDEKYHASGKMHHSDVTCSGFKVSSNNLSVQNLSPPDRDQKNDSLSEEYERFKPENLPLVYFVNPGDTLEKVAKTIYGDSSYAWALAKQNGLMMKTNLSAGQVLSVPQIIPDKNNVNTARPYNEFVGLLKGHLMPHFETPSPKEEDNTNLTGIIIKMVAIAIVLAAAPYLAGHLILAAGGTTGLIAAGGAAAITTTDIIATGVVAALGDAAIQGLAVKFGVQDKFSLTEMVETGVTAGSVVALGQAKTFADMAKQAMELGVIQVSTQLAEMSVGMRSKFDAQAIATQVAANLASAGIQSAMRGVVKGYAGQMAMRAATTVSNSLIGSAINHTPVDVSLMAAQMVGNTIGSEMGSLAAERLKAAGKVGQQTAQRATNQLSEQDRAFIADIEADANRHLPEARLDTHPSSYAGIMARVNQEAVGQYSQSMLRSVFSAKEGVDRARIARDTWTGFKNEIKQMGSSLYYAATHPMEFFENVGKAVDKNLSSYSSVREMAAALKEESDSAYQGLSQAYSEINGGNYEKVGEMGAGLLPNMIPAGKIAGLMKYGVFAGMTKGSVRALKVSGELDYIGSPKHGKLARGNISPEPINGQKALDNSVQIKDSSTRRIGIDPITNDFVVFDQTIGSEYHGHVRSWDELNQQMKNKLVGDGMVNRRGKLKR